MNETIWKLIEEAFEAADHHLRMAVALFDKKGMSGNAPDAYYAKMAFMHSMQSAHSSVERGLVLILELYKESIPTGQDSHTNLIKAAAMSTSLRPAIVDHETEKLLQELRKFRNFAAHSYEDFDPTQSVKSVEAARRLIGAIAAVCNSFKRKVEPGDDEDGSGGGASGGPPPVPPWQ